MSTFFVKIKVFDFCCYYKISLSFRHDCFPSTNYNKFSRLFFFNKSLLTYWRNSASTDFNSTNHFPRGRIFLLESASWTGKDDSLMEPYRKNMVDTTITSRFKSGSFSMRLTKKLHSDCHTSHVALFVSILIFSY